MPVQGRQAPLCCATSTSRQTRNIQTMSFDVRCRRQPSDKQVLPRLVCMGYGRSSLHQCTFVRLVRQSLSFNPKLPSWLKHIRRQVMTYPSTVTEMPTMMDVHAWIEHHRSSLLKVSCLLVVCGRPTSCIVYGYMHKHY